MTSNEEQGLIQKKIFINLFSEGLKSSYKFDGRFAPGS